MNEKTFTIGMFKDLMANIMKAHMRKDGTELQNLESEIVTKYQVTTMTHDMYAALKGTCSILLDDWRRNYK